MFDALSAFVVIALLALWSLAAWAMHAIAVWPVSNASALSGATLGASTMALPGWLARSPETARWAGQPNHHGHPTTLRFAILSLCLVAVTAFNAWRLGNQKRDVVLLGAFSGLIGAGTAASVIL